MSDVEFKGMMDIARGLGAGDFSSVDLVEHYAGRIQSLDPVLNAFRLPLLNEAMAAARTLDAERAAGNLRGPLHGIPYAAKDLFDVAGQGTSAGSPLLENRIAARSASVVDRLDQAGMVLLGKTNTVQFAYGGAGVNTQHGTPHNPWHREHHLPGGSSSGSGVAVAAGMAPMALGSDTGGSVRIPAALCGITGLKTTVGRVSRAGVYPLSWSLDSVGPLCRDVVDAAAILDALNGEDPADNSTHGHHHKSFGLADDARTGIRDLRVAFAETAFYDDADPEVVTAVNATEAVFRDLGVNVTRMAFPEAEEALLLNPRGLVIAAEAYSLNRDLVDNHFDELDPIVAHRLIKGQEVTAADYLETVNAWNALRGRTLERFRDIDILLCPATMIPARPLSEAQSDSDTYSRLNLGYLRNTAIGNILNLSGLSVPCGFTSQGLPVGLMMYARPFGEARLLAAGAAFQAASDFHLRNPDLSWIG